MVTIDVLNLKFHRAIELPSCLGDRYPYASARSHSVFNDRTRRGRPAPNVTRAAPEPDPFPGTSRHNPGTLNLSWSHTWHSFLCTSDAPRSTLIVKHLRLLGHNLAAFPNVNRCSVHARHLPGSTRGSPHPTTDTGGKALRLLWRFSCRGHGPRPSNLGLDWEFSYIAQ